MYIPRNIEKQIKQAMKFFPVLVLTGARQAGKTTALREILPNYNYISLDLPSLAEQAERDPEAFFKKNSAPLIIDEVQYAPSIFRHLKTVIDKDRHSFGKFILTGSQHFALMQGEIESLAGRIAVFELENLNIKEIAHVQTNIENFSTLKNIIVQGQFPELWRNKKIPASLFYSSYLATYLERDVRQILNVANLRDFERCIRVLASRSGSILNKSDVAKDGRLLKKSAF